MFSANVPICRAQVNPHSRCLSKMKQHRDFRFDEKKTFDHAIKELEKLNSSGYSETDMPNILRTILGFQIETQNDPKGKLKELFSQTSILACNRYSSKFFPFGADKVITKSTAFLLFYLYAVAHEFKNVFTPVRGGLCGYDGRERIFKTSAGGRFNEFGFMNWLSDFLPDIDRENLEQNLKTYMHSFCVGGYHRDTSENEIYFKEHWFPLPKDGIKRFHQDIPVRAQLKEEDIAVQTCTEMHDSDVQACTEMHDSDALADIKPEKKDASIQRNIDIRHTATQFEVAVKTDQSIQVDLDQEQMLATSLPCSPAVSFIFSTVLPNSPSGSIVVTTQSQSQQFDSNISRRGVHHRSKSKKYRLLKLRRKYLQRNKSIQKENADERVVTLVNKGVMKGLKSALAAVTLQATRGGASLIIGDNNFVVTKASDSAVTVDRFPDPAVLQIQETQEQVNQDEIDREFNGIFAPVIAEDRKCIIPASEEEVVSTGSFIIVSGEQEPSQVGKKAVAFVDSTTQTEQRDDDNDLANSGMANNDIFSESSETDQEFDEIFNNRHLSKLVT